MVGNVKKEHPLLGIASICFDVCAILLSVSIYYEWNLQNGIAETIFLISVVLPFIAFILGIGGLFQKGCKKIVPIIGIALSLLPIFISSMMLFSSG